MVVSRNDNFKLGKTTYHIQTEFYKAKSVIVCNIFKDGKALKKIEKEVDDFADDILNEQIQSLHNLVLERLKQGSKEKAVSQMKGYKFFFPEDLKKRIVDIVSPFFGAAIGIVWEDAVKNASNIEQFIDLILRDLAEIYRVPLENRIRQIIVESMPMAGGNVSQEEMLWREKILIKLAPFFGVQSNNVLDLALSMWNHDPNRFIEIVLKKYNGDKKEELEKVLFSLF